MNSALHPKSSAVRSPRDSSRWRGVLHEDDFRQAGAPIVAQLGAEVYRLTDRDGAALKDLPQMVLTASEKTRLQTFFALLKQYREAAARVAGAT